MSYILEALKKAQAERQLGSAPTLHALPIHAPDAAPAGARRGPLLAALGIAAVLAAALAWTTLRAPAPAPVVVMEVAASAPPAPVAAPPALAPPIPAPPPPPVARPPEALVKPVPPAVVPPKAEPAPPAVAEDTYPLLRELPEAVQRDVPAVAVGGYIYSKNPADRLLLIDKILRREGEEVAPGLVLEKLQPKAAVMNFRGTRYRVPY